jgi:hypothetical protein
LGFSVPLARVSLLFSEQDQSCDSEARLDLLGFLVLLEELLAETVINLLTPKDQIVAAVTVTTATNWLCRKIGDEKVWTTMQRH